MTFYTDLRDSTVQPLLAEFGQAATWREYTSATYDNTTGKRTDGVPSDTTIQVVEIKKGIFTPQEFSEETIQRTSKFFLVGATEFATAGVTPSVEKLIVLGGKTYRVLEILEINPGGTALGYKMATMNA